MPRHDRSPRERAAEEARKYRDLSRGAQLALQNAYAWGTWCVAIVPPGAGRADLVPEELAGVQELALADGAPRPHEMHEALYRARGIIGWEAFKRLSQLPVTIRDQCKRQPVGTTFLTLPDLDRMAQGDLGEDLEDLTDG